MKRTVLLGMLLATTCLGTAANADLVRVGATNLDSFVDLGAQGFGAAPRILTEQTNTFESGSVAPGAGGTTVLSGDAISGADKASTPTLGFLGWTSSANVEIGFNSDQTGNTGITLQQLTLTLYNGTTALGSFSLAAPIDYTAADLALQQGNGNAVFGFVLNAAEKLAWDALNPTASMTIGLFATLGCAADAPATCQPSNDGPDSFVAAAAPGSPATVPLPAAAWLFGSGMGGLALLAHRKRKIVTA